MRLIVRRADPANKDPIIAQNDSFSEAYLPGIGDLMRLGSGEHVRVAGRRFRFGKGARDIDEVELFVSPD